jgi:putative aldouronate transport system substrate-binding protein
MKRLALILTLMLVLSSTDACTDQGGEQPGSAPAASGEVVKPASIHVVVNGTVVTQDNGRDAFEQQLEELTGVDIIFDQQDHSGYADALGRIFASGDWPDIILLPPEQYGAYALEGALWDMTSAYENAEFQSRLISNVNDYLQINGKIYGIAPTRGNGCHTFVKQAWLDAVGISTVPSTWAEYYDMLVKFTNNDPDGDGEKDTYGVAAAGLIGLEVPYINYLPEFYQDAYPDFLQDANGTWYDGFDTPAMEAAFTRLQQGYKDGVIDPESLTMTTSDARNKFYEDSFGVFTYWAGTWKRNLMNNLDANGLPDELVTLPPIAEMGDYIERHAAAWSITSQCENPEGVFKYFLEPMLDGGEGQFLWSYGAKGTHWDDIAETITWGDNEATYAEGEFHMLPTPETPDTLMTKNHLDPLLTITPFLPDYVVGSTDAVIDENNQFFVDNAVLAPILPNASSLNAYSGDIWDIKREVLQQIVVQGNDVSTWMDYYRTNAGAMAAEILAELNE